MRGFVISHDGDFRGAVHVAFVKKTALGHLPVADLLELRRDLIAMGHHMESVPDSYMDFGAGQFIVRTEGGYVAASDPRRDGQAAGF